MTYGYTPREYQDLTLLFVCQIKMHIHQKRLSRMQQVLPLTLVVQKTHQQSRSIIPRLDMCVNLVKHLQVRLLLQIQKQSL